MTQALYLNDVKTAKVDVLSCQISKDGLFEARLSETPFHPQGGGQPSDIGTIYNVQVMHVTMHEQDIIHYCANEVPLGIALAQVDVTKRNYFSRLHSAGHLIAHIVQLFGWTPIKAQHWPNDAKVQFIEGDNIKDVDSASVQKICNQYIQQAFATQISQNSNGYREVGFGDLGAFPCGGTHVKNLSEINQINITEFKFKKGKLTIKYQVSEEH